VLADDHHHYGHPPTPTEIAAEIVARLTTLLDLTGAQQIAATTIFTTEQTALQTATLANKAADIMTAATTIGTLTTQQVTADATGDAAFYAIFTTSQQTKYTTLRVEDLSGPDVGGHGPGGHGSGRGHEVRLLFRHFNR
jgi:hypothetical protein